MKLSLQKGYPVVPRLSIAARRLCRAGQYRAARLRSTVFRDQV
jgi:hypothetical protein